MNDHNAELDVCEHAYKQAVLAVKILDAAGSPSELVQSLRKQADECLGSESRSRRTFALHLLRFFYKTDRISIGWFAKRRIRGLLRTDPSPSVRLAAFDILGAILTRTGSKSGVQESDYSTILDFRQKMLERSPALRKYEISDVAADVARLRAGGDTKAILERLIKNQG